MAVSVSDSLHDSQITAVRGLGLTLTTGQPAVVKKRKLSAVSETIDDDLPAIFICPAEHPGVDYPFDTGTDEAPGNRYREYWFQVAIVTANDGDNQGGLPDIGSWRQRIIRRFGKIDPLPEIPELMQTNVDPGAMIDRSAHSKLYDYSVIGLRFGCVEPAGD